MQVKLDEDLLAVLTRVVTKHALSIEWQMSDRSTLNVDASIKETLLDAILTEFVAEGLDVNGEPNKLGLQLESLIDAINRDAIS